ncbi:hypothetical protein SAMN04487962_1771 [Marinobacter segnicrescens]|uniref:Uncharacterized protein n=1 Tax=Marinobacter segnicrescens TaxID=430453 RepID=A0A1I0IH12_9GAMM|nr:hypothetical protein [Marinobacter segnicrescens]SET96280.1 hypothetical protein SAMN04487962_1771 [Marinobacter segnicrescens]
MFDFQEAAKGYAKAAERVLGEDAEFLNKNQEVIPVFVALLFQSMEISLKHLGVQAGLFSIQETKDKKLKRNGHGVGEIASLINERLGASKDFPVVNALTARMSGGEHSEIVREMLFGSKFEATRQSYQRRNLGYLQLEQGDLALVRGLKPWVSAVRDVAENLPVAVDVVKQWKSSSGSSRSFAIWFR